LQCNKLTITEPPGDKGLPGVNKLAEIRS
jgi:hypothetical protein